VADTLRQRPSFLDGKTKAMLEDRQLSQMFLRKGLLDQETLEKASEICKSTGRTLYDVLLGEGLVSEERAIVAVSKQLNLPCVSLKEFEANQKILELIPRDLAIEFRLMALGLTEEDGERKLYVAMANPLDIDAIEKVSKASGFPVFQLLAGPSDIKHALARSYPSAGAPHTPTAKTSDLGGDDELGDMLDGLFDKGVSKFMPAEEPKAPPKTRPVPPAAKSKEGGLGEFTLDFGDLELSLGNEKVRSDDVHSKMTLPAGTELPSDLAKADFARTPTTVRKSPSSEPMTSLATESDNVASNLGLGDDWSDLGDFDLDDDGVKNSPSTSRMQTPTARTETSTIRYVADLSLQGRPKKDHFPFNVSSNHLVRATVMALIQKGVISEAEIKDMLNTLRRQR